MEISIKRISTLSSLGFLIVFALACASSGCAVRDGETCTLWSGCDDDAPEDTDDGLDDTFDPDFPDTADDPTPEPQPEPDQDPTGPIVPMDAPYVSYAPTPTNVLSENGSLVPLRMTVTAPAGSDVLVRKLSFSVNVATAYPPGVALYSPALRVVGASADLQGSAVISDAYADSACGFSTSPAYRCVSIVLDEPLTIDAMTSVTVDFRLSIASTLNQGDTLTTSLVRDIHGLEKGPLTDTGIDTVIKGGTEDGVLWSNDGLWFYNGHDLIGTPWAHTLTRL